MKRSALPLLLLAVGCPQERTAPPEVTADPAIACDKAEHQFGTVAQGQEVKHTFTVHNRGKGLLKIDRAKGG